MTQDQHKLEPCPFCGDDEPELNFRDNNGLFYVECPSCMAQVFDKEASRAITAWNRRAHLQQRPLPVREGTERDAARYRWLRDTGYWYTSPKGSPWAVFGTGAGDASPCCGQALDAAIDAGMADMPPLASSPSVQNSTNGVDVHVRSGWLPIATAPKDGTRYIAASEYSGHQQIMNQPPNHYPGDWELIDGEWRGEASGFVATHWKPLDPAPGVEEGQGG